MPGPANDQASKDVHAVTDPLYRSKVPAFTDVQQAPNIANCPVAAILAAMASTAKGRAAINDMLSEKTGTVLTDLSNLPAGTLSNPPANTRTVDKKLMMTSSRYFTVRLGSGGVDVSDVLYTDDHDSGWSPIYLRDPKGGSIWASIIEKAIAVELKSYENFDSTDIKVKEFWQKITGKEPGGFAIKPDTPLDAIKEAAQNSTTRPTIGATKENGDMRTKLAQFHGLAMIGFQGGKVQLYDPAKAGKPISVSLEDFRNDFQAIFFTK
jgi:hypothetical protein